MFLFSNDDEALAAVPDQIDALEAVGVQHVVLSFYQPPSREALEKLAPR
jgi:hypothetical protein